MNHSSILLGLGGMLLALSASGAVLRYVQPNYLIAEVITGLFLCAVGWRARARTRPLQALALVPLLLAGVALPATVSATNPRMTAPAASGPLGDNPTVLDLVQRDQLDHEDLVGRKVTVVGQVFATPGESTPWTLTRLRMICCAADAVPYGVRVADPLPAWAEQEQWVQVQGTIAQNPLRLVDVTVTAIPQPERPYL